MVPRRVCILVANLLLESGYLLQGEEELVVKEFKRMGNDSKYRTHCLYRKDIADAFFKKQFVGLRDVIYRLFNWGLTVEGDDFWRAIAERINEYELPEDYYEDEEIEEAEDLTF